MAATVKDALADAGVTPESVGNSHSIKALARSQGQAARHFTLAQGCEWADLYAPDGSHAGRIAVTVGRNDVLMLSYVPAGGRIQEIPVAAALEVTENLS